MKHPKTTVLGILTILGAVIHAAVAMLNGQALPVTELAGAITAGCGLIFAADGKV